MKMMSNEQLCILAQQGDAKAQNLLIENNLPYIKKTAYELWNAHAELNRSFGIMQENLIQEGSIGLYHCIGLICVNAPTSGTALDLKMI